MLCCVAVGVVSDSSLQKTTACTNGLKSSNVNGNTAVNGHVNGTDAASEHTAAAAAGVLIFGVWTVLVVS